MRSNRKFSLLLLFCLFSTFVLQAQTQRDLLQSGPMVGYTDMKEVLLWVQTSRSARVQFEYWEKGDSTGAEHMRTEFVKTSKEHAYTAKFIADEVKPGKVYEYQVRINGTPVKLDYPTEFKTQDLWQWRTDPPAFDLAIGSCSYINEPEYDRPGTPYGSEYEIFTSIHEKRPDLMIWLGDNIYYREPDWSTRTGMHHRYTHTRSLPEMQPLLASTSHYAIWDDHDYGPNDSDGTWIHKEMAWEVFKDFWGNPTFGIPGQKGCTTYFQYMDIDFFLLDNRYFRTPNYCESCPRTMLGEEQLAWFKAALAKSRSPFKIVAVGGQVVSSNESHETFSHFFPAERDSILAHIEREDIKGVVFLTGDRHFTEFSVLENGAGNKVYDLTCSSLTAGVYTGAAKEANAYRQEGSLQAEHNFSILHFSGPRTARVLELSVYDTKGELLWQEKIEAPK